MSTIDEAARVIRDLSDVDGETIGYMHAHNIAKALADAGLLMPDLPEMKERYGTVQNDWVRVDDDGALWIRYGVDDSPLTPTEAHALALSLLAADNYAEGETNA